MSDLAPAVPGIDSIPASTRRQIARGARYSCTYSNGVVCMSKHGVAWCTRCRMPRCEKHVVHGRCATCNAPVFTFAEIAKATPHDTTRADGAVLLEASRRYVD